MRMLPSTANHFNRLEVALIGTNFPPLNSGAVALSLVSRASFVLGCAIFRLHRRARARTHQLQTASKS